MDSLKNFFPECKIPSEVIPVKPNTDRIIANPNWFQKCENLINQIADYKNILLIVNDAQRSTPTAKILDQLSKLDKHLSNKCSVLIATGTHLQPGDQEIKSILGKFTPKNLFVHQAKIKEHLMKFGTTSSNNEIWFNRLVTETELIITVNSIEPHYFAGYTGGRKSFLPGIAGYESIERNHKHALHPKSRSLNLVDNPVHKDMTEAMQFISTPYKTIQIITYQNNIIDVFCGDLVMSFSQGVNLAKKFYEIKLNHPADLVIVEVNEPYSQTMYQAQKALIQASYAGVPGGEIIFIASCQKGIGNPNYYDLLSKFNTPRQVLDYTRQHYKLGYHKAYHMALIAQRMKIFMISQLTEEILDKMYIRKIYNPLDKIQWYINRGKKIIYLPNGEVTVPCITNSNMN